MQKLTYSRTRETKLNESYELLNKLKKEGMKKEALYGKQKKITITTYKNKDQEIKNEKQREITTSNINEYNSRPDKLSSFSKFTTDNSISWAGRTPTEDELMLMSEEYLKFIKYTIGQNKDYIPIEKTEHTRKKTFVFPFNGNVQKSLATNLLNIYKQQKFTFKVAIEFTFLLITIMKEKGSTFIDFKIHYASTNTRPNEFKNPVVVDNKKDVDNIIKILSNADLIEQFTNRRTDSKTKFYKFLEVKFHVYEMNTPIGKINELPKHFKEGSNEKALIKYEKYDDYLCFWRCLAYHQTKPEDPRNINKKMKSLFKNYYGNEQDIKNYNGVEYVAYDKEYNDETLDNDDYDKRMMKLI